MQENVSLVQKNDSNRSVDMTDDTLKNIVPGYGLGPVKFGMTRSEVEAILGKPDEIEAYSYSDCENERTESWDFSDLGISLNFDEEDDWKLVIISAYSNAFLFKDKEWIGLEMKKVLQQLEELKINHLEPEDYSSVENPDHQLVEIEGLSMNFWFSNGHLDEIQWSPFFVDDDTLQWPQ